ncbi:MAG TPA: GxxExxY protein [Ferruginibacter sp.]|nr:GxxExxY protein [Ferruginibacter sp.]
METNVITYKIIGAAYEVHRKFGPCLLESAYRECLVYLLKKDGFLVEKEKVLPLVFEEITMDMGYRLDLLVENRVVVELKVADSLNDVHIAQILT